MDTRILHLQIRQTKGNFIEELYMKSLFAKGARSIFMTSEKNAFLCASLYTRLWKTNSILNLQYLLFASYIRIRNAF